MKKIMYFGFQFSEPSENYEEDLSREAEDIINTWSFFFFCGLFSDFQYGFRSSRSTADLLRVVSGRIARAFNRSRAT